MRHSINLRFRATLCALVVFVAASPSFAKEVPLEEDGYCGHRCVNMMLQFHGIDVSVRQLATETPVVEGSLGTSLQELSIATDHHELESSVVRFKSIQQLRGSFPAIVHVEDGFADSGHFVFVAGLTVDDAIVWDGLNGISFVPLVKFDESHSGHAIVAAEKVDFAQAGDSTGSINDLLGLPFSALNLTVSTIFFFMYRSKRPPH